MDLAKVLSYLYPDLAGWEVVDRGNGQEITKFPDGVKKPTQKELADAWKIVKAEQDKQQVQQEREARYRKETDPLLYDALAKMDLPELAEWQDARMKIKKELPKPLKM